MQTELVIFICFCCLIAGLLLANYWNRKDGETADAVAAANEREPLIFKQVFNTRENAQQTIQQAENAIASMIKHGNRFIRPALYPKGDVHLWIHGADGENTNSDFEAWRFNNLTRERQIIEAFRAMKAQQAAAAQQQAAAAKMWAGGNDDTENLN